MCQSWTNSYASQRGAKPIWGVAQSWISTGTSSGGLVCVVATVVVVVGGDDVVEPGSTAVSAQAATSIRSAPTRLRIAALSVLSRHYRRD